MVEGRYYGLFDTVMWMANVENWQSGSNEDPAVVSYSIGIPQQLKSLAHLLPMNNAQRLQDTFNRYRNPMAAMLIEPIQGDCCGILATVNSVTLARSLRDHYGLC